MDHQVDVAIYYFLHLPPLRTPYSFLKQLKHSRQGLVAIRILTIRAWSKIKSQKRRYFSEHNPIKLGIISKRTKSTSI